MSEGSETAFLKTALSSLRPNSWKLLREHAEEIIRATPLPSQDQEEWKYIDLQSVFSQAYNPATNNIIKPLWIGASSATETAHSLLVITNGQLDSNQSNTSSVDNGIVFSSLTNSAKDFPEKHEYVGKLACPSNSDMFSNINTACFEDGVFIYIPKGRSPLTPLHIIFRATSQASDVTPIIFPRILVVLEPGAKAHIVEEYFGEGKYLTNSVLEIFLGEGASLAHDRTQHESMSAFHFCTLCIDIGQKAKYTSTSISMGGSISRQKPICKFTGEHGELELNYLSLVNTTQIADTHSTIEHQVPNCTSKQVQKFIVDNSAHGIFRGQIKVHQMAQGTSASQSSRNLLLAKDAKIDTMPQLEILADDVKCSHGATVGQLDAEELFYLQSRGLDLDSAKNILLVGFATDIINHISLPSIRNSLLQKVLKQG
ncbi:MAG: Fe-S cluster assembly protein SufD [Holophagaceae bacterium]|nr:Fe-S cluster assembly protein SufD [Holophagaceae bacterium]